MTVVEVRSKIPIARSPHSVVAGLARVTASGCLRTPEQMALLAAAIGILSATGGLAASLAWDTPAGLSIVVVATVLFAVGLAVGVVVRGRVG